MVVSQRYRSGDQTLLREINLSTVLRRLQEGAPLSRARLANLTGLNKTTVSSLVEELIDRGLVHQVGLDTSGGGRPATLLELASRAGCIIWGQHPCYGWPFVDDTCRLYLPPCRALTYEEKLAPTTRFKPGQDTDWPWLETVDGRRIDASRIPGPVRSHDHVYLTGYREGWYALTNEGQGIGLALRFDPEFLATFYRDATPVTGVGADGTVVFEAQSWPRGLTDEI
jgi:hypothetical protein